MNTLNTCKMIVGLCLLPMLAAAAGEPDLDFYASGGYLYDSNVSVDFIDTSSGDSDSAWAVEAGVDATLPLSERATLRLGYAYSGTFYQELSEFDLAIHQLQGEFSLKHNNLEAALGINHFIARLDGDDFVDVTYAPLSLSAFIGEHWYLRGSIAQARKDYAELMERDADTWSLRGDAYYLIDGMQKYIALTLQHEDEDAESVSFDYKGMRGRIAYSQRMLAGKRPLQVKAYVQYEERDYSQGEDLFATARQDERYRMGIEAVLELFEHVELSGEIDYADNRSNLQTADYDEMLYAINVGYRY